ncbi:Protein decapping like [Actinidia chinensis var. chinensis]|uniref:Protein decapping like n=1 Tax=Actinidia chinensis var. chinensis TaxID=1590841 RepID=A0A2R6PSJ8_ACTCC|nr:Protein decapping like [Actinidia chinensis var. chinensis]
MQQLKQNPTVKASLSGDASHFAESSRPLLSTVYTGSPNSASSVPPPLDLPSSVPIRQSAILPSKLSPNLIPNNSFKAIPMVTLGSHSPLVSPFTASSLDVNPVVPLIMDKPVSVPYQTISQSMPSAVGSSSPVHGKTPIPSLLTPGQLLQPGSTGHSSSHMQTATALIEIDSVHGEASMSSLLTSGLLMKPGSTGHSPSHLQAAHKEVVAIQSSSSESMSSDSENVMDLEEKLPPPSAEKLNGAALHTCHSNKRPAQRKGKMLTRTAAYTNHSKTSEARERGNLPNQAAICSHHTYRGSTRGRASTVTFHPCKSNRGHSWGRENGPNKDAVYPRRIDGSRGQRRGTQVSPTTTKFTEDFDFEAMNEKFNKEKIWGHLGRTNISRLEDKEGDEKANDVEEDDVDQDGLPKFDPKLVYVKDDFFDSISCNSLHRGLGRGRVKLSEQRKVDIETFGEILRQRRGCSSWGRPGRGVQSRGSHRGRGYGYTGRGRELAVWSRVT